MPLAKPGVNAETRIAEEAGAHSASELHIRQKVNKPNYFLLFDLDGTISDPIVGISRSMNHALVHFGHSPRPEADFQHHIGPPLDDAFRALVGLSTLPQLAPYVAKYRERYASIGYSESVLYPGIREVLTDLNCAGVQMGVCTSKRVDFAERILEMFGIRHLFRFVNGGEVGIQKWQQIQDMKANGLIDDETIMIGDRAVDVEAGHRNGIAAAGVLWGYGSRDEIEAAHPNYTLASPVELADLAHA